jgi:hypothetical protein
MEELAYMASIAKDEFADVVENATSILAGELAAKSAEAHGAQTKSQQQTKQSKQLGLHRRLASQGMGKCCHQSTDSHWVR